MNVCDTKANLYLIFRFRKFRIYGEYKTYFGEKLFLILVMITQKCEEKEFMIYKAILGMIRL